MSPTAILWQVILISAISAGTCAGVGYAFNESGSYELEQRFVSEYNGSELIGLTVASDPGGGGTGFEIRMRSAEEINNELNSRIEVGHPEVRKTALIAAGKHSGEYCIDQICEIYDYLWNNYSYVGDPRDLEYYQYSNQTINSGQEIDKSGIGDCDDYAILMASLIEQIGGTTRIIMAYGPEGGHAYTEVYLGQLDDEEKRVQRILKWLRKNYGAETIYVDKDFNDGIWLNLDWSAKHPGGPFFPALENMIFPVRDANLTKVKPVNEPPVAIFTCYSKEPEPSVGTNITFNASLSRDPYGVITSYKWDFGDDNKSEGRLVDHYYSEGGNFTVTLTVADKELAESKNSSLVTINWPPEAHFEYSIIEKSGSESKIALNASESKDRDGRITSYEWDFGDGEEARGLNKKLVSHNYMEYGIFLVNLTVVDDDKSVSSIYSLPIKINKLPVPKFSYYPKKPNQGKTIIFDASQSEDKDGNVTEYRWYFGDETSASGNVTEHAYPKGGNFTVRLEVTDDDNETESIESTIYVNKPPVAFFTYTPREPLVGDPIHFISNSSDEDGYIPDENYEWNFKDGIPRKDVSEVYYNHLIPGNFTVTLTVTDDNGATDNFTARVAVREKPSNSPPNVTDITPSLPSPQTVGNTVKFFAYASDPEGDQILYKFYLKDPAGVLQPVGDWINANWWEWTPADPGDYEIQVRIRDGNHAASDSWDAYKMISYKVNAKATEAKTVVNKPPMMLQDGLSPKQASTTGVVFMPYFVPFYDYAEASFTVPSETVVEPEYLSEGNYSEGKYLNPSLFINNSRVLIYLLYPCVPPETQLDDSRLKSVIEAFNPGLNEVVYSPAPLNIGDRPAIWGQIGNDILVAYQPSNKVVSVLFFDNSIEKDVLEYFLGSLQITISGSPLSASHCVGAEDNVVIESTEELATEVEIVEPYMPEPESAGEEWLSGTNPPSTEAETEEVETEELVKEPLAVDGNILVVREMWTNDIPEYKVAISPDADYVASASEYTENSPNFRLYNKLGDILWSRYFSDGVEDIEVFPDGEVIVGDQDGKIYSFDTEGNIKWEFSAGNGEVHIDSTAYGDQNYYYVSQYNMGKLDEDGMLLWDNDTGIPGLWKEFSDLSITSTGDKLVTLNTYSFEAEHSTMYDGEGREIWEIMITDPLNIRINPIGTRIIIGCYNGNLYSFDNTGQLIHTTNIGEGVRDVQVTDNLIGVAVHSGTFLLDYDGNILCTIPRIGHSVAISEDEQYLVVGSFSGVSFYSIER